jgi:hypothetical protein
MPRMTIDLPEKVDQILKDLAVKDEITKGEVLRRAIAIYKVLKDSGVESGGNKVVITDPDNKILKEIVF